MTIPMRHRAPGAVVIAIVGADANVQMIRVEATARASRDGIVGAARRADVTATAVAVAVEAVHAAAVARLRVIAAMPLPAVTPRASPPWHRTPPRARPGATDIRCPHAEFPLGHRWRGEHLPAGFKVPELPAVLLLESVDLCVWFSSVFGGLNLGRLGISCCATSFQLFLPVIWSALTSPRFAAHPALRP